MRIDQIRAQLAKWEAADAAITANKSYSVDGLSVTKQDAASVREQINYWSQRLAMALRGGAFGVRSVRAIDRVSVSGCTRWPQ